MKTVKIITSVILGLGIALAMSGCSTTLAVMGMDGESAAGKLRSADVAFSHEENIVMQKDKSYVVLISSKRITRDYLYEDIDGKLVLVGSIEKKPGKAIIEVKEGKHTYVSSSSCGAHTMTINAEKGNAYYIQDISIKKLSTMSYCRTQAMFQYFTDAVPNETFKKLPNFSLNSENVILANSLLAKSSLPSYYENYKKDIAKNKEDIHPKLRVIFPPEHASAIN